MGYTPEELQSLASEELNKRRQLVLEELKNRGLNAHVSNNISTVEQAKPEDVTEGMNVLEKWNYYNTDFRKGILSGGLKAVTSAGKFVTDIAGATSGKKWLENGEEYLDDLIGAKTAVGEVGEVVGQVGVGIVATGGIGGGVAINLGRGAVVEGVFFDEKTENIAKLMDDYDIKNDVIEYLKGDKDDSALELRFKNALTGAGLGVALESIFGAFRYGKKLWTSRANREAFEGTDDELIQEIVEGTKADAKKAYENVANNQPSISPVNTQKVAKINQGDEIYKKANELVNMSDDIIVDTKKPLNAERIATDNQETFAKATEDVVGETPSKTLKETLKQADAELKVKLTSEQFDLMEELTDTATKVSNLDLKVSQQRIVVGTMAKELDDSIKVAQKEGGAEAMVTVINNLHNLTKTADVLKTTQKSIAQAMSAMRINTENSAMMNSLKILDAIDPDYSIQALKNAVKAGDDAKISKLLDELSDPAKSVKDHVDNYKDSAFTKVGNVLSETVVAGMLSAPSTLMVNIIGNSLVKHQRAMQDVAQFAWGFTTRSADRMKSRELRALMYSNYGAVAKDISLVTRNMGEWFKSGLKDETFDSRVLARYVQDQEFQHAYASPEYIRGVEKGSTNTFANNTMRITGRLARTPYRAIGAIDDYYKRGAFRNELVREGSRLADKLEISDEGYNAFIDKFIKANTELQMLRNNGKIPDKAWLKRNEQYIGTGDGTTVFADRARDNANYMTFQKELGDGVVGKTVDALNSSGYLRLLVPFKLTPINLLKYSGRFIADSPLGLFRTQLRKDIAGGGVKRDIALAKMSISTSVMTGLAYLATSGNMTGSFSPKERRAMNDAGIPEYSFRVGNTWYEYKQIEPFATLGGMMVDMFKLQQGYDLRFQDLRSDQESDEMLELIGDIGLSIANNITNKTYAKSLLETLNVATGQQSLSDYSGNLISSAVPFSSLANFTGRTLGDGYKKEAKTFTERIQSKYRGLLERDALDAYGRRIKDVDYVKGLLIKEYQIDKKKNAGAMEVARLGIQLSKMNETISEAGIEVKLTPEEYWKMRRSLQTDFKLSDKLNRVVKTKKYKSASDNIKKEILSAYITEIQSVASTQILKEERIQGLFKESIKIEVNKARRTSDKPNFNDMIIGGITNE